ALIDVPAVVLVEGHDHVAGVDRSTEELNAVVVVGKDLHVVDGRARTDATEGKTVDLATVHDIVDVAAVADGDVGQRAAVVRVVLAELVFGGIRAGLPTVFDGVGRSVAIGIKGERWGETLDTEVVEVGRPRIVG